ncbi:hypothetical protein EDD16DRAFT_1604701, partial [Pisolithus croceorrhizus]
SFRRFLFFLASSHFLILRYLRIFRRFGTFSTMSHFFLYHSSTQPIYLTLPATPLHAHSASHAHAATPYLILCSIQNHKHYALSLARSISKVTYIHDYAT